MTARLSRRAFLTAGLASTALPLWAEPPGRSLRPVARPAALGQTPVPSAEELIADARLTGRTAFVVADPETGQVLESRDSRIGLPVASVAKTLTAIYALDTLGGDFRFRTRLIATGPVAEGRLKGDLVLAGSGDPTLDTDGLATLAANLKAAGIHEVTGRFLYWGGALPEERDIDPSQPEYVGYNPGVSGLNLNYNRVHFQWVRDKDTWNVSMDARTAKYRPDVRIARMRVVQRQGPVYTYADAEGTDDWTVASSALGKGGSRWLPVRRPAAYTAEVFQTLARSHGIVLKAPKPVSALPRGAVLTSLNSAPLTEIVQLMLKYSNNLVAESIGMAASMARGAGVTSITGSARRMNRWGRETLGLAAPAQVDHSGLGDKSRLRMDDLAGLLATPRARDLLRPLLKDYVLRSADYRPDPNHPIKVEAKTGTLNFVSGLAGYMRTEDGRDLAFAVVSADVDRRATLTRAERDRPEGGRAWAGRARRLQQALIERWGQLYGT
ncbi:D-alanyl-D-alanine carboxypeptidase/D-alanyl-D-alanine-endopeptidase [Pseudooceanicola aestuarii]|uniref:D-alanyl-D-alanine carboxypeptidase/D-alanyl-D-alanine endopeptidase n=1 Tax=Pseudooceanicola aestuarii TaxID=2697319 RepID=UPI0013D4F3E8|nr:D-alanyl-D-alanine carboxypeptidase/D-alanyl-D-alanine-endopeptidase [Pseudooceanicola aestuarii]